MYKSTKMEHGFSKTLEQYKTFLGWEVQDTFTVQQRKISNVCVYLDTDKHPAAYISFLLRLNYSGLTDIFLVCSFVPLSIASFIE